MTIKLGVKMEKSVFDISEFNIIQDDENYYVFRALSNGDYRDIREGITSDENGIFRVRTDRERFEGKKGNAKYNAQSQISLEEVWDHIKIRFIKETNCISLSSNANVSIDYGQGYNEEYVMVRIPKQGTEQIYSAGQYMLEEVSKKIDEALSNIPEDSKVLELIRKIDAENSHKNIRDIVSEAYEGARSVEGKFSGKGNKIKSKTAIVQRFDRKQYFTDEQQLEYSKTIAKLTVLETHGILKSILPTKLDNSSLIATIGNAFSSGELVHYGDIDRTEMKEVPKEIMDILSLVQQLKDKNVNKDELANLQTRVIRLINDGYKITKENGQFVLGNGTETISINDFGVYSPENEQVSNLSIEDVYKLTKGRISYEKAKIALEFVTKTSQSRLKAIEYANIIRALTSEKSQLSKVVEDECFAIDKDIISREDHRGLKISESVNIGLSREQRRFVSNQEQLKLIAAVQGLEPEELRQIIATNGLAVENHILGEILEKTEEISENQYFAEAIVDGIDFGKIYKTTTGEQRTITEEERNKLVTRLNNADCKKLYNAFINAGVNSNDVPGYIINLLMDNGYKGHTLQELSRLDDLDTIIANNTKNLNCRIQALRLDKTLGIEDDSYVVPQTSIRLRDYQQDTVQNIDRIHEDKRFAGMVLPTGAGKSFVAMTEMMKYKNSNIIFIAPQNTILSQFQNHILKNILHKRIITDEEIEKLRKEGKEIPKDRVRSRDVNKVIEEVFPHLKLFCYATLNATDEEWMKSQDVDLIVLDELHRAGAQTWKPQIQKLLENNPNAKILGMTATPVRDADHEDMARVLAEMSGDYTKEELMHKEYLASEMHVLDAMQDNIVVKPKIVTFDYTLEASDEYQEVKGMMQEEKDPAKKEELSRIYKEMTAIIKASKKQGMNGILAENIKKKNGRYIVFLPNNTTEMSSEEYIKAEIEKVKEYFKDVNPNIQTGYLLSNRENAKVENATALEEFENSDSDELKLLFAIDMLNEGVHVDGIDGAVMLRPISENSKILYLQQIGRCIFSLDPNNPIADEDRPIIFDVYNNYLAQNMDREANKTNSTSDLQRLKAVVSWIERHNGYMPDINSENTKEARRAVTLKNIQKKYKRYIDGIENKNLSESERYEIEQILELGKSIELWELEIPQRIISQGERDIIRNDTFKVTGTQREFIDLFKKARNLTKGKKRRDDYRLSKEILPLLDILSEYGIEINNRTIGIQTSLEDIIAKLPEEIRNIVNEEIEKLGLDKSYKIGEEYNFAKESFYDKKKVFKQYDIKDLRKYGIFEEFIRTKSKAKEKKVVKFVDRRGFVIRGTENFINVNINTGTFFDEAGYDIERKDIYGFYSNQFVDENRFGRNEHYYKSDSDGNWVDTGSKLTPQGLDRNGDYWKRNKQGKLVNTHTKFGTDGYSLYEINERGFSKEDHLWYDVDIETGKPINPKGEERDEEGYDFWGINIYQFGLNGNYYKQDKNGNWVDTGSKLNPQGFDRNGDYWKRNEQGELVNTHTKFGSDGYSLYEINERGFSKKNYMWWDVNIETGKPVNPNGARRDKEGYDFWGIDIYQFGLNGNYYKQDKNGNWIDTGSKLNPQGLDRNGDYWKRNKQGKLVNTHTKFGTDGYSLYEINERGFSKEDHLWYDVDIETGKPINPKGEERDEEGYDFWGINIYQFRLNGNYYKQDKDGNWIDTGSKLNPQGLDRNGDFWEENEEGILINTHSKFGSDSYSWYGINERGFSKKDHLWYDVDIETGKPINPKGEERDEEGYDFFGINIYQFGLNGNYYKQDKNGNWVDTGSKLNPQGLDRNGDFWEENEEGILVNTHSKFGSDSYSWYGISERGFSKEDHLWYDVDIETGKPINPKGEERDEEGYDFWGINIYQFGLNGNYYKQDKDGNWIDTGSKLNPQGLDRNGDFWEENEEGILINTHSKFGSDSYSWYGINERGFSKKDHLWYDVDIETGKPANPKGEERDKEGYDFNELTEEGKGRNGRWYKKNSAGQIEDVTFERYTKEGYSLFGIDENNFGLNGNYYKQDKDGNWLDTGSKINPQGLDKNGDYWEENEEGILVNNHSKFGSDGYSLYGVNELGFKADKLWYGVDLQTGKGLYKDGQKYDEENLDFDRFDTTGYNKQGINRYSFNREGFYCKQQEDGTYLNTGLRYNEYGFRADKRHIITQGAVDFRAFNIDGICKSNGDSIYDKNGFKFDGTYMETGEKYHEGYNAYGVDEEGKDRTGKVAFEITFSEEYINAVFTKGSIAGKEVIKKYISRRKYETNEQYNKRIEQLKKEKLYLADQMYPKIRNDIAIKVMQLRRLIKQREEKISQLDNKKASDNQTIEKLQKENDMLRQRINLINPMQEISK